MSSGCWQETAQLLRPLCVKPFSPRFLVKEPAPLFTPLLPHLEAGHHRGYALAQHFQGAGRGGVRGLWCRGVGWGGPLYLYSPLYLYLPGSLVFVLAWCLAPAYSLQTPCVCCVSLWKYNPVYENCSFSLFWGFCHHFFKDVYIAEWYYKLV